MITISTSSVGSIIVLVLIVVVDASANVSSNVSFILIVQSSWSETE